MSLDVSLRSQESQQVQCTCSCCGHEHTTEEYEYYFDANVTHNLAEMASAAGLYDAVWRPDENGFTFAKDIIQILEEGILKLELDKNYYRSLNPKNGWGSYDKFVPWLKNYLEACKKYPDAVIVVSR
jgi:hypothetical protein